MSYLYALHTTSLVSLRTLEPYRTTQRSVAANSN